MPIEPYYKQRIPGRLPRELFGTAPPSSASDGSYEVGDIVWNTAPTAGGYIGWVCVAAGSPGTWKGFGAIAS